MVKDYMKKQVVIQAIVWTGDNTHEITKFMAQGLCEVDDFQTGSKQLVIPTLEGDHRANKGDYIIKGVKGEFYPCKPDIFEMSYEEVTEERTQNFEGVPEEKEVRGFDVAIRWLKKGKKVTRKEWEEMETYIYYDEKTGNTIYTNGLTETEWIPTSSDILENDWEIYE